VAVRDVAAGGEDAAFRAEDARLRVLAPDGSRLVLAGSHNFSLAGEEGSGLFSGNIVVRVWDLSTGRESAVLRGHEQDVTDAVFSPDGKVLVTCSRDHTARLWQVPPGTPMPPLHG